MEQTMQDVTKAKKAPTKHRRRFCKVEGCEKIVKSQGLCQKHGAKPRSCKIAGCSKQAQGNFNGMCKAHFRSSGEWDSQVAKDGREPSSPSSTSNHIASSTSSSTELLEVTTSNTSSEIAVTRAPLLSNLTAYHEAIPASIAWEPQSGTTLPLICFLKKGIDRNYSAGWHRNEERALRRVPLLQTMQAPFEAWELELLYAEVLLLAGHGATGYQYLAFAWGQAEDFHLQIAENFRKGLTCHKISDSDSEVANYNLSRSRCAAGSIEAVDVSTKTNPVPKKNAEDIEKSSFAPELQICLTCDATTEVNERFPGQNRNSLETLISLLSSSTSTQK